MFLALPARPAFAQDGIPSGATLMFLKDHEDFQLAWSEGEGVHLTAEGGDRWRIEPVREEALTEIGEFHVVHDDSGQCMDAGPLDPDGVHAHLDLVDCADAEPWSVVYDDVPSNADFRFATPEGYLLGLEHPESKEEHSAVPTEGAEVFALDVPMSLHSHEWLFAEAMAPNPPTTPPATTQPPGETPSSPEAPETSASPKPTLPTTGTALGLGIGAGAAALVGGAVLVLWWQRRRALRADW
ncbi:hypothetical protein [Glycomyces sp. NPDC048151]|uniref:hypothetical protein n=1 Tax=Glycomyces sp. NPDC048151 TaxID=3364002 RepID=UPI00371F433C